MGKLTWSGKSFYLDNQPFQIISGSIHYFRIPQEYWHDRLLKLKACGFNTVETYTAWNMHEPEEGEFYFDGMCDIEKFIQIAWNLGLRVIVRPGPYICAEWEFGGFPAWLLKDDSLRLRCSYQTYLDKVKNYFNVLLPKLVPYLSTNNGPIIAIQVENEYGSYGNDRDYLRFIENCMKDNNIDCMLFTSDGYGDFQLNGGTLPGIYKTVNFGSHPAEAFAALEKFQPDAPLMCCEFWNGWFDQWGQEHHTNTPDNVGNIFDEMLDMGASVNFYMFHGGTNFGFMNGANRDKVYSPTVTSYDYDALLSEAGDMTEKYFVCKSIIEKHFGKVEDIKVENSKKIAYGTVMLEKQALLFESIDLLSKPVKSKYILPMEKLGQNYGFILYRNYLKGPRMDQFIHIKELRDRALIFADGIYRGSMYRDRDDIVKIDVPDERTIQLDILVENMGRVNYGPYLKDCKGITEGVSLNGQYIYDWEVYTLPLKDLSCLKYVETGKCDTPAFYKGCFWIDEPQDTFLRLDGWEKGIAYINGINLGRYWKEGPQKTLYVPGPFLVKGKNVVEVFELYSVDAPEVQFVDNPKLG
jgi:Beta-galactosidase